jgi:hypothetical protein
MNNKSKNAIVAWRRSDKCQYETTAINENQHPTYLVMNQQLATQTSL